MHFMISCYFEGNLTIFYTIKARVWVIFIEITRHIHKHYEFYNFLNYKCTKILFEQNKKYIFVKWSDLLVDVIFNHDFHHLHFFLSTDSGQLVFLSDLVPFEFETLFPSSFSLSNEMDFWLYLLMTL